MQQVGIPEMAFAGCKWQNRRLSMRDLTLEELGNVYGAGDSPTPPTTSTCYCPPRGSKGKGSKNKGSKNKGSKNKGSKRRGGSKNRGY